MLPYDSKCFNMLQNASMCFHMPQYAVICFNMLQYASLCFGIPRYASICFNMSQAHFKRLVSKWVPQTCFEMGPADLRRNGSHRLASKRVPQTYIAIGSHRLASQKAPQTCVEMGAVQMKIFCFSTLTSCHLQINTSRPFEIAFNMFPRA